MEVSGSLINKICSSFSGGLHFAKPIYSLKRNEVDLVRGVLQIVQGFSNSLFYWDHVRQSFYAESGIYVTHLSQISLQVVLNQFIYAATCLKLIEIEVSKLEAFARSTPPTLRAFACSISSWLSRLRDTALKEEVRISSNINQTAPTLLGLANSLSSVCSGAEFLWKIVHEALPQASFEVDWSGSAADIAVHILDYLYNKLNEVCLVQGGEEDAYRMILHVFVGSLLPYVEGLDSWLFEGILDDPFEEMFFYSNRGIAIDEVDFWEKSYLLRSQHKKLNVVYASEVPMDNSKKDKGKDSFFVSNSAKGKEKNERELKVCPLFIKDIGMAIISAGKSLQLIRHAPTTFSSASSSSNEIRRNIAGLALTEGFCVSLASLIGHSDHISNYFWQEDGTVSSLRSFAEKQKLERNGERLQTITSPEKMWYKFLFDALSQKRKVILKSACEYAGDFIAKRGESITAGVLDGSSPVRAFQPENPCITVCQKILDMDADVWSRLNLSRNFYLPPLNDYDLRNAIFGGTTEPSLAAKGTNYASSFLLGESSHVSQNDARILEALFPFPTLLPSVQEDLHISEFLPFQKNSTLPSKVMSWIQCVEPKATPLPVIILQECLIVYIKRQVDSIGKHILSKLLYDWRLLDELGVLRDIYLLGSGDLLQHFLTVIFSKLDKGESWDDDFELNTILQESIRNSADGVLLSTPDSLVVSFTKDHASSGDEENDTIIPVSTPCKNRGQGFGINGLESLKFTYKVPWPLELIANTEAIKKYNQVMSFLLKVKRAKFVLDKARRWMWKDRGIATINRKHQWLVEQKLLHFVDAFHQYVMDRVYHSAWLDLCEGMAAARSLDVVIDVHEAYLLSIQRQCFVVPDKLWALIASRINSILGLALDFYSVQQTLNTGGAVSAIKARCEMEVDRIERHFDDCIAFLLRVLSFKLNVGQFPHLADLVTRINYNHFYMSNSGNLINAPVSDTTTSKLGKAFPVRKE